MTTVVPKLRVARPVTDLARSSRQYAALGLSALCGFAGHAGFDGAMLGVPGAGWHLELVRCGVHPRPTEEDLLVFYVPDGGEWAARCAALEAAGWAQVTSANPYWEHRGRTYADGDGYRVVIQQAEWTL